MKKVIKFIGFGILAIIILGGLATAFGDKSGVPKDFTENSGSPAQYSEPAHATSTVLEIKGSGKKTSKVFHLQPGQTRIKYKYTSSSHDMGVFAAYVLEEGVDINKEGGIPDIMTSEPKIEDETFVTKMGGNYYIQADGMGKWEITIEN